MYILYKKACYINFVYSSLQFEYCMLKNDVFVFCSVIVFCLIIGKNCSQLAAVLQYLHFLNTTFIFNLLHLLLSICFCSLLEKEFSLLIIAVDLLCK